MLQRTSNAKRRQTRMLIILALLALFASQLAAEPSRYSRRFRQSTRPRSRAGSRSSGGYGATKPQEPAGKMIQVNVLDEQGNVVEDALVGSSMLNNDRPADKLPFGRLKIPSLSRRTIGDSSSGTAFIGFFLNRNSTPHEDKAVLYAFQKDRKLCAMRELSESEADSPVTMKLEPACRVFGYLTCSALTKHGLSLSEGKIDLYWEGYNPLCRHTQRQYFSALKEDYYYPTIDFEFFLPPGEYGIRGYSTFIVGEKRMTFTVKPGQAEFNLGAIDLPGVSAAKLIGQKAPPIGPVTAWLNGEAIDLAKTQGKNVLLCFGRIMPTANIRTGTSASPQPRTSRLDPALRKLGLKHSGGASDRAGGAGGFIVDSVSVRFDQLLNLAELFKDDLIIAAIYSHGSENKAKAMLANMRDGGNRTIPISVAIDGRPAPDSSQPLTWARYEVKNRITAVMIDRQGNIVGALDHTPYGEEIERAFEMDLPWRKEFLKQYTLGENEYVKYIARPPLSVRRGYWLSHPRISYRPDQPATILFAWENGGCVERELIYFNSPSSTRKIIQEILGVGQVSAVSPGPGSYQRMAAMKGDWLFRPEATYQQKSLALEKILSRELRKKLSLQLQHTAAPTVTVSGDYRHQALSPSDLSGVIHVFADEFDPAKPGPIATARTMVDLLREIGNRAGIDLTVQSGILESDPVRYTLSREVARLGTLSDWQTKTQKLNLILKNLTSQTNLKFDLDMNTHNERVLMRYDNRF